ncbi:hypothetical protein GGP41_003691 [Bipolaris sorokiniana]|uniref:Uncharacterized protein n=1 Tax=Cochliobolus sativus TaxID=45130 RepID=A0A8H5Z9W3_COCSA|nr:hypothetical protein GGP41_003691 [Bipolaris sorokiniana]
MGKLPGVGSRGHHGHGTQPEFARSYPRLFIDVFWAGRHARQDRQDRQDRHARSLGSPAISDALAASV